MFSGLIRVRNRERRIGAEGTAKLNIANSSSTEAQAHKLQLPHSTHWLEQPLRIVFHILYPRKAKASKK